MTRVSDDFTRDFEQSTVMPPAEKEKTEESAQAKGKGGADTSVTLDSSPPPPSSGSGSSGVAVPLVPPPPSNPNLVMAQVQSLQSKMSANQMDSSANQLATDHQKMAKAIKTYNDRLKQEHKAEHKAHSKGLIGKIVNAVEDAAEIIGGAVIMAVVPPPGGLIAGGALMATGIINTVDQGITGQLGGKALVTGKAAEDLGICCMAATVAIGVCTAGAGFAASAASAASDTADAVDAGVQVAKTATQTAVDAGTMTEEAANTVVNAATTAAKTAAAAGQDITQAVLTSIEESMEQLVDAGEVTQDTADSVNGAAKTAAEAASSGASQASDADEGGDDSDVGRSSDDDIEMKEMKSSSQVAREQMDEEFDQGFEEDVVDGAGDSGDGSDDDGSGKVSRRKAAIESMKVGAKAYGRLTGMINAAGGITQGVNTLEIGKATEKAKQYEADAEGAQKDIQVANMDTKQVLGDLQTQMQQFEAINKDLTSVIMSYAQTTTDTAVQGYA